MPCDSSNTFPLTITRDASGNYSVSADPLQIPLHACIAFSLVGVPATGCTISFDHDFHGHGRHWTLTAAATEGPMDGNNTWTYTIADASMAHPKKLGDTQHTIQVGSGGGVP